MNAQMRNDRGDSRIEQLRVPPQSVEAEQAVLGGVMLAEQGWDDVADLLTEDDFYRRDHQLIFRAIKELHQKTKPYDAVTLGEWFETNGMSEHVAGGAYLTELATTTPSAANIRAYAEIVRDKSLLRDMIEVGTGIVNDGFQPDGRDVAHLVASASARVATLSEKNNRDGGLRMIGRGLTAAFNEAVQRNSGVIDCGVQLPYANVRALVPGLEPGDLFVLAARPSMGKTTIAMEIAEYIAEEKGVNVAIFSLEMSETQLMGKMIARKANVDFAKMRRKDGLSQEDWEKVNAAKVHLSTLAIAIDDQVSLTIDAITARAARMKRKLGSIGLIVVDYLQLIEGTGSEENRQEVVRRISRGLKVMAKLIHCPVIALSQLNRTLETRTDKRPVMSDLRESGAIEQDADVIAFIHREGYYTKDKCAAPDVVEVIIAKQRLGQTGTAYLKANLATGRSVDFLGKPNYRKGSSAKAKDDDGLDDEEHPAPRSGRDRAAGDS